MKTMQCILVAMAAVFGTSCVDTVGGETVTGPPEDVSGILADSVVGMDSYDAAPDVALDTAEPPFMCLQDVDCQPLFNACNFAVCRDLLCKRVPIATVAACDDGDPCTINTHCDVGKCVGEQVCTNVPIFHPFYPVPPVPN